MNNMDVQVTELQLPSQTADEGRIEENDHGTVTTVIPSTASAGTQLDIIADDGREVMAASRKQRAAPKQIDSSIAPEKTALVLTQPKVLSEWESRSVSQLRNEFMHTCLPLFFADENPLHSLGITSAVPGEGKTWAAWLASHTLATSSRRSIVLVECDWERSTFSRDLGLPGSPGLAEYLTGDGTRAEIRHQFLPNLTVIAAGAGGADAMTALAELQRSELYDRLADPDELMILDLPSVLGSSYGVIAARLAESLMVVVRAGDTPSSFVARASEELKHLRVEGIILNRVQTRVPRWLQRLL